MSEHGIGPGTIPFFLPGWTEADMQACMSAGTPGKMHEHLAKGTPVWPGKTTMWMAPDTEPMKGECASIVTSLIDGRYVKCEMTGDCPAMGPYSGLGIYGYDNVSQESVSNWIDNHSTSVMNGKGELSPDGKTITHRDRVNARVMKDSRLAKMMDTGSMPFDCKRMAYGGFKVLVDG